MVGNSAFSSQQAVILTPPQYRHNTFEEARLTRNGLYSGSINTRLVIAKASTKHARSVAVVLVAPKEVAQVAHRTRGAQKRHRGGDGEARLVGPLGKASRLGEGHRPHQLAAQVDHTGEQRAHERVLQPEPEVGFGLVLVLVVFQEVVLHK